MIYVGWNSEVEREIDVGRNVGHSTLDNITASLEHVSPRSKFLTLSTWCPSLEQVQQPVPAEPSKSNTHNQMSKRKAHTRLNTASKAIAKFTSHTKGLSRLANTFCCWKFSKRSSLPPILVQQYKQWSIQYLQGHSFLEEDLIRALFSQ